jgi:NADH:ubiquinone oxidoreductase subunit C
VTQAANPRQAVEGVPGATVRSEFDAAVYFVDRESCVQLALKIRDEGYAYPRCLSGVDHEWGLEAVTQVLNPETGETATIRAQCTYDDPHLPTLTGIWPGLEWHEREAYDLVGIVFDGHPDLRRILNPDEWEIFPLQKRYDTGGYPVPGWQPKEKPEHWPDSVQPAAGGAGPRPPGGPQGGPPSPPGSGVEQPAAGGAGPRPPGGPQGGPPSPPGSGVEQPATGGAAPGKPAARPAPKPDGDEPAAKAEQPAEPAEPGEKGEEEQ